MELVFLRGFEEEQLHFYEFAQVNIKVGLGSACEDGLEGITGSHFNSVIVVVEFDSYTAHGLSSHYSGGLSAEFIGVSLRNAELMGDILCKRQKWRSKNGECIRTTRSIR